MKKLPLLILALMLFPIGACKADEKSASEARVKCQGSPLAIEIDGYVVNADREGLSLTLIDGTQLGHLDNQCDKQKISNVILARWPYFQIADSDYRKLEQYQQVKQAIEQHNLNSKVIDSGVKNFASRYYTFPKDTAPTGSEEPVSYFCSKLINGAPTLTGYCNAEYVHPNGLLLRYRFFRKDVPESRYFYYDQQMRRKLESLIIQDHDQGKTP